MRTVNGRDDPAFQTIEAMTVDNVARLQRVMLFIREIKRTGFFYEGYGQITTFYLIIQLKLI